MVRRVAEGRGDRSKNAPLPVALRISTLMVFIVSQRAVHVKGQFSAGY